MAGKTVRVQKSDEKPETKVVLASAIVAVSKGIKALRKSGLNKRAVVVLLHDSTRLSKRDINLVLDNLEELADIYCGK